MTVPVCEATGKRRYPSKSTARRACRKTGNRIRVYACRDCGGFHVTNQEN